MNWNVSAGLLLVIVVGSLYGAAMHQFLGAVAVAALVWTAFLFGRLFGMQEQQRIAQMRRAREEWRRQASLSRTGEPEWVSTARRREWGQLDNRELRLDDRRN